MIKYNPKIWVNLLFHSYSRQVLRLLLPALIFMGAYTTLLSYMVIDYFDIEFLSTTQLHSLMGIVLGLFLVFRTNTAYDRWYEGRKQWGALVNCSRNLALKIHAVLEVDRTQERNFFAELIPMYSAVLKEHLRKGVDEEHLVGDNKELIQEVVKAKHGPNYVARLMYKRINQLLQNKVISGEQLFIIDNELRELTDITGACERIRNTPIPYSYSMYLKKFILTFILTLPLGLITTFGYYTIPIVLLISYILMSIELIAEEIEDPFGTDINDLPTDELYGKIKDNVETILLDTNVSVIDQ